MREFNKFSDNLLNNENKSLLLTIIGIAVTYNYCYGNQYTSKAFSLRTRSHGDESVEEVLNEIVIGKPSHSEMTTEEELNHNTNIETSNSE